MRHFEAIGADGRQIIENSHVQLFGWRGGCPVPALFAAVENPSESRVSHYLGIPPDVSGEADQRIRLPVARVLVIQGDEARGAMLNRFAKDGGFAGDTWHQTVDDAIDQARFEYGDAVGDWREVPAEATNAFDYALIKILRPDANE